MLRSAVTVCLVAFMWTCSQGSPLKDADHEGGAEVLIRETRNVKPGSKWPNGRIPYVLDATMLADAERKKTVLEAIKEINGRTCVKWVPRRSETAYVQLKRPNSGVCDSLIGGNGGRSNINLGSNCRMLQTALHEMMHTMGFDHEHNRPDRDQYVTILWDNIKPGMARAFTKKKTFLTLNLPYDYSSVMHYFSNAWSKDRAKFHTIMPKGGDPSKIKLVRDGHLSPLDVKNINTFYGCPNFKGTWQPRCYDRHHECAKRAGLGDCTADWSSEWMKRACEKTCRHCRVQ